MRKMNVYACILMILFSFKIVSCYKIKSVENIMEEIMDNDNTEKEDVSSGVPLKFNHPGILHTKEDIERLKEIFKTANENDPAYKCYMLFAKNEFSQSDYKIQGPFEKIGRQDAGRPWEKDFNAACQNATMYAITGDEQHALKSVEILKSYAMRLKEITPTDEPLLAGIMGVKLVYAAEIMHYLYPQGLNDEDFVKVCGMFKNVFQPVLDKFFSTKPYTNGNWGASVNMTYIAIAVLTDDMEMYKKALDFYVGGNDNGNILNYIDDSGQCQESGRDQQHVQLGLECLAKTCEIAFDQGTDLYGAFDNRLLKGYEYTSKYNLGYDVQFKTWKDVTGKYCKWTEISQETKKENGGIDTRRGQFRPVFEMVYNHFKRRKGLDMPYTEKVIELISPEGYYYEHFGFGTLLFNDGEK